MDDVIAFYDAMAADYQSLYRDWEVSVGRQAKIIDGIIRKTFGPAAHDVLDATCGIGTQAIGLARLGYRVTASDVSAASVERASREAARMGADVRFSVADVRSLPETHLRSFDAAISFDNALPHLVDASDLEAALRSLRRSLRPGGVLLVSVRDYDAIQATRPTGEAPRMLGRLGSRRVVAQVWDWDPIEPVYRLLQFVLHEAADGVWSVRQFETRYRALGRAELGAAAAVAGFADVGWLEPAETGFYQPIMTARART